MEDKDVKILAQYVKTLKNKTGLVDWEFFIDPEPDDDDDHASLAAFYGQKRGILSVNKDFKEYPLTSQRMFIVHELVHAHLAPTLDIIVRDLEDSMTEREFKIFFSGYKRNMEFAVDAIASSWAKELPLIEWDDEEEQDYWTTEDEQSQDI